MTPIHVTVDSDTGQATYSEWHPEGVDVPRPELTAAMEDLRRRNILRREPKPGDDK